MLQLILVIAPIALLDSTSIVPVCLVPLAKLLASRRPILAAGAMIAGVYVTYLLCGVLIYFGYPQALEKDAERAARTALAINEALPDLAASMPQIRNTELAVRIGIDTGLVVVGEVVGDGQDLRL